MSTTEITTRAHDSRSDLRKMSELSASECEEIKRRANAGESTKAIAFEFGIHTSKASRLAGRTKTRLVESAARLREIYPLPVLERYVVTNSGCWNYTGHVRADGYGITADGPAHRIFYTALVGPIPAGFQIDHLCKNRTCVNPKHLEAVTHYENLRRSNFGGKLNPIAHQLVRSRS